jgi:hypothetical protein
VFVRSARFYSLLTIRCSPPLPSHQTTEFPPTLSIHSTSASHVRMIKLQYCTLTVIIILATIPCDPLPPHIPVFLLLTIHYPPPRCLSPRTRKKRRKPFPFMQLLHNSRIPRGRGSLTLWDLRALYVKINTLLLPNRPTQYPASPARNRLRINTHPTIRDYCIPIAYARLKSFRCNAYKKPGGGSPPHEPFRHSSLTTSHFGTHRHTSSIFCLRA